MAIFKYEARDKKGDLVRGSETAQSRGAVIERLRQEGLFPISVEEEKSRRKTSETKDNLVIFKDAELIFFTRQLAELLSSGINLVRALSLLGNQTRNAKIKGVIHKIYGQVSGGGAFWQAVSFFPLVFDRIYIGMVKAGETGGNLDKVMIKLAELAEQKKELKDGIVSMLIYPVVVLLVGAATVFFLMSFVIPKMLFVFSNTNENLPLLTRILISASLFFSRCWWLVLGAFCALIWFVRWAYLNPKTRIFIDGILYKIPAVWEVTQKWTFTQATYVLGLLISNGLTIIEALDITKDIISNHTIRKKFEDVRLKVAQGSSVSASMSEREIFPQEMVDLIGIGEETGKMEAALLRVSDIYRRQLNEGIKRLLNVLEPLLIIIVAVIIGFLVAAILLPLFEFNLQFV